MTFVKCSSLLLPYSAFILSRFLLLIPAALLEFFEQKRNSTANKLAKVICQAQADSLGVGEINLS